MIAYSAADVPILQIGLSSKTLPEQQLTDLAVNFLRPRLTTIEGAELPAPYGGRNRQVNVDLDPQKLFQRGISGSDVVNAVNAPKTYGFSRRARRKSGTANTTSS